jgi:intergrase/recombinase
LSNKHREYAHKLFGKSKKFWQLGFNDELITMKQTRTKLEIMKALGNLTRFLDIMHDTNFHEEFLTWLKRKEIHWTVKSNLDTYLLGKRLDVNEIIKKLTTIPTKYQNFGLFVLVSGLRTSEALQAFNNHDKLCCDGIMELFWDRRTKKANAVYCHPFLHDRINHTMSRKIYRYVTKEKIGFDLRDLRKINYTINATKIDPLLAEFMQGRRGNISQRHYFLPMLNDHKKKWIKIWAEKLSEIL